MISLQTILIVLLKQIDGISQVSHQPLSEELKISVVNCIECLFRRATSDVTEMFYTKENLNILGKTISICDLIVNKETFRPLR